LCGVSRKFFCVQLWKLLVSPGLFRTANTGQTKQKLNFMNEDGKDALLETEEEDSNAPKPRVSGWAHFIGGGYFEIFLNQL
jgi:hypothetical protein